MGYRILADVLVLLHAAFVLFVVGGGLLVLRWPRLARIHLPAALWGVLLELFHWGCPLTRLENHARLLGGEAGYPGGFIDHYIIPVIYPSGLTPQTQVVLGLLLLVFNLLVYARLSVGWRARAARRSACSAGRPGRGPRPSTGDSTGCSPRPAGDEPAPR